MPPKVLLLTAGYGEGHNAAARGLHAALLERGADAEIIDLFALTGGAFYERSRRGYLTLINRAPHVWSAVFALIDRVPIVPLSLPFLGKMRRAFAAILAEKRPVAVVSVYPLYAYLIRQLYPDPTTRPFAFHTVVTDSITINSVWHRAPSDTFILANDATARVMASAGVPADNLRVLGFPVQPIFARDRPERPAPPPPRVLYMVNAAHDQAPGIVTRLLLISGLHLTVAYGRDETLRQRLEAAAAG
ncbi:MAG: UDP-N-acetylglucosamine--LPS N-acetylglucosamine transferase, partial [Tepidisphaeraceae bacterium]